jgi:uncharacterized protein (DUF433 family)
MRITASQVLEMLAGGMTPEDILRDFLSGTGRYRRLP